MLNLVRIALARPYTFVVLALLILIVGPLAALRTPVDIFPEIRIPVIAVVWQYTGLPPDEMSGRVMLGFQRSLTTTVNDIEHIEGTSYTGVGIVKVFFQPGTDIRTANSQVTAIAQTVLKQMPPNITPPLILNFNASTVPIIQIALAGKGMSEQAVFDIAINTVRTPLVTVQGAAIPFPFGGKFRQIQIDLDPAAMQARGLSANDVANALAAQNLLTPVGTQKIGGFEYSIQLNNAPKEFAALADLPVFAKDGTIVYLRDVAQVRDGNPPQQNIVHVDGSRSVLLAVLKNGATSTLSIIEGVKQRADELRKTLPENVSLAMLGDQSLFVEGAVSGVAAEAVIAAVLTSLMILLFLGSWRSTVIIAISIPLAILGSIALLAAFGETLNIMTLGGLALAVGILVDDATVTIENINWHLEQGKDVETAIMDGARADRDAGLRLAALHLHRLRADVLPRGRRPLPVRADGRGGDVRDGLLVHPVAHPGADDGELPAETRMSPTSHGEKPPTRNPLVLFQRGFEARFERFRAVYRELLAMALGSRTVFIAGFMAFVLASFALAPMLGRNFFPSVDAGQILMHARVQVGTRVEETANQFAAIQKAIREIIPSRRDRDHGRQCRHAGERHQPDLQQHRRDRPAGRRHPDQADRGSRADRALRGGAAPAASRALPGRHLLLPAGRHHQPDPELRRALADRRPGADLRPRRGLRACQQAAGPHPHHPGHRRRAHPAVAPGAGLRRRYRPHARPVCRADDARRHQLAGGQPRRQRPGRADLLAQSGQRHHLQHRDADAAVPARFARLAVEPADHGAGGDIAAGAGRLRRYPARARATPWSRSTTCRTWSRSTPACRAAISAPSPPTFARSWPSWRSEPRPRSARSRCRARSRPWKAPSPACCSACSARSC